MNTQHKERPKTFRVEDVARICHETNRVYCQTIGDNSQPLWFDAPEWQRNSAINGVQFKIDNPGSTPEQSHENWLKQKEAEGWSFGDVKDPDKKKHPCFIAYEHLPVDQRLKDALFQNIVVAFMSEGMIG